MIPIFSEHLGRPELGRITDDNKIQFYDMSNPSVTALIDSGEFALDPAICVPGGRWEDAYIAELSIVPKAALFRVDQEKKDLRDALRETTKLLEHVSSWNCESSADYAEGIVEENADLLNDEELRETRISREIS